MTSQTKKGLLVIALIAVLVLVYYSVFADASPDEKVTADNGSDGGATVDPMALAFPLKLNSRGENVKTWQNYLYTKIYHGSAAGRAKYVDGIFGPITQGDTVSVTGSSSVPLATFLDAIGAPGLASVSGVGATERAGIVAGDYAYKTLA